MSKLFNIGDKVIVTEHNESMRNPYVSFDIDELFNLVGRICYEYTEFSDGATAYGVVFDKPINGHSCNNSCKDGYGQYINEKYLKLYKETKTMQKEKHEKKPLEQQIKERCAEKREKLILKLGIKYDSELIPNNFYYNDKGELIVIDFGRSIGKIKAKPTFFGDTYNLDTAFTIFATKAIYKNFHVKFDSDMSSFETRLFARYLLYNNTCIKFEDYVEYLKKMERLFIEEANEMKKVEQIRKNQKAKNKERKAKQKAKKQNK